MTCTRFDDEALLKLQADEPLDSHFAECADCLRARREYDAIAGALVRNDPTLTPSAGWEEALYVQLDRREQARTRQEQASSGTIPVAAATGSSDAELFERWAKGDRSEAATAIGRYFASVRRFFSTKTLPEHVDVLIQETLSRCIEAGSRVRERPEFRALVFGVAHNLLREHLRSETAYASTDVAEILISDVYPEARFPALAGADAATVHAALRMLPLGEQELLELYYWEDLTVPELANVFGIREPAVRSRIRRARERLRQLMLDSGFPTEPGVEADDEFGSRVLAIGRSQAEDAGRTR